MILITVKFRTRPEWSERWPALVADFTAATRAEPGNRWFEWSRSLEDPSVYVLLEAFDDDAAEAHVTSDHFAKAMQDLPQALAETPMIINTTADDAGWGRMGEMQVGDGS